MELKDKVVVVTGAGQGIGQAISYSMAKEGAKLAIYDLNPKTAKETSDELNKLGYEAIYASGSVSDKKDVKNMFKLAINKFKRIDILVNNAGICKLGPIEKMNEEDWDSVFDVNAKGLFICTQEAVKVMKKQNKGCIINMTSMHGLQGMPERGPYSFTKAGIINLTKTLAAELGRNNIRVNVIAPGFTNTKGFQEMVKRGVVDEQELIRRLPLHALVETEDIANAAVFLASEKAKHITGIVLPVDSGWLADGGRGMSRPSES